jgi:hypothetical protein
MTTMSQTFYDFLATVDAGVVERDANFIKTAGKAFIDNRTCEEHDLIEFDFDHVKKGARLCCSLPYMHLVLYTGTVPDSGIGSFMKRAARKAEANYQRTLAARLGGSAQPQGSGQKENIVDLVRAVRSEDAKLHVDLSARLSKIIIQSLPTSCHPSTDATDKLASLRKNLLKLEGVKVCLHVLTVPCRTLV